jgi:hypothetical protein
MESPPSKFSHHIVVALLLLSIGASATLLYFPEIVNSQEMASLELIDEIILSELTEFNIKQNQIKERNAEIGSGFNRKVIQVSIPQNFSKTFLHSELAFMLKPLSIATPSTVSLPDDEMNIHIYWRNTVVRTIELRNSSNAVRNQSPGAILLTANTYPPKVVLNRIAQMGEPVRLILKSDNTDVILSWLQQIPRNMKPPLIALDYGSPVSVLSDERFERYIADVMRIRKQTSNASLILIESSGTIAERRLSRLRRTGIYVVVVRNPILLDASTDRELFRAQLQTFVYASRTGELPVLILPATAQVIDWLKEDLVQYKKGGLVLAEPEFIL